jgi:hypothetical protein
LLTGGDGDPPTPIDVTAINIAVNETRIDLHSLCSSSTLAITNLNTNQSYFIKSSGGSGKTTILKQIQIQLTQQDKIHSTLCPTNLAALLVA